MNKRFSRLALKLLIAGSLSATLIACSEKAAPLVDDSTLNSTVKAALAADPELKGFEVVASSGVVQLSGTFDSYPQIDRALSVVRGVPGVLSVNDKTSKREDSAPLAATPAEVVAPAAAPAEAAPAK
jgi:hyperosmotically inducible protein